MNPNAAVNTQVSFDKKRHRYLKQTLGRYPVEEKQENRTEEETGLKITSSLCYLKIDSAFVGYTGS